MVGPDVKNVPWKGTDHSKYRTFWTRTNLPLIFTLHRPIYPILISEYTPILSTYIKMTQVGIKKTWKKKTQVASSYINTGFWRVLLWTLAE